MQCKTSFLPTSPSRQTTPAQRPLSYPRVVTERIPQALGLHLQTITTSQYRHQTEDQQ
jgi:hypothetical protein